MRIFINEIVYYIVLGVWGWAQSPEQRAIDYLAGEVPRWSRENHCFSCHNNGDGARALYAAAQRGRRIPKEALADTTRWLLAPGDWDHNRGNPAFSDKKLARIQFAAALAEAYRAGLVRDRRPLREAAASLVPYQEADGSWQVDAGASAGSPATYGAALATCMARGVLEAARDPRFAHAVAKADHWLRSAKPRSIVDAAAVLLADAAAPRWLAFLLPAQNRDGGWGPQPNSPAEPFDTAVVLLALRGVRGPDRPQNAIARGRAFLAAMQLPSGGWPETTRPPGARSYAQHISTSAWATLALLATGSER
jgi:hypothetical protein